MSSLLNSLNAEVKTFTVILDVRCKSTLISNIGGILSIFGLDDLFQVVVGLDT